MNTKKREWSFGLLFLDVYKEGMKGRDILRGTIGKIGGREQISPIETPLPLFLKN